MAMTPIRHFRCEDEIWNAFERMAKDQERTASWLTRKAVEEYMERYRAAKRAAKSGVGEPTIPQALLDRLEKIGAKTGQPVATLVQRAIEEFIAFNE